MTLTTKRNSFYTRQDAMDWVGGAEHIITEQVTESHGIESVYYEVTIFIQNA